MKEIVKNRNPGNLSSVIFVVELFWSQLTTPLTCKPSAINSFRPRSRPSSSIASDDQPTSALCTHLLNNIFFVIYLKNITMYTAVCIYQSDGTECSTISGWIELSVGSNEYTVASVLESVNGVVNQQPFLLRGVPANHWRCNLQQDFVPFFTGQITNYWVTLRCLKLSLCM